MQLPILRVGMGDGPSLPTLARGFQSVRAHIVKKRDEGQRGGERPREEGGGWDQQELARGWE